MAYCELCKCFKYLKLNMSEINTEMKLIFGIWFKIKWTNRANAPKKEQDKSLGSNLNQMKMNDYLTESLK